MKQTWCVITIPSEGDVTLARVVGDEASVIKHITLKMDADKNLDPEGFDYREEPENRSSSLRGRMVFHDWHIDYAAYVEDDPLPLSDDGSVSIRDYISRGVKLSGLPYRCMVIGTNQPSEESESIFTKTDYESGESFNFLERLQKAHDELRNDVKTLGLTNYTQAFNHYKSWTEKDNMYYWGCWLSVFTDKSTASDTLCINIRMD